MSASVADLPPRTAEGVVQRIDLIEREMTIRKESGSMTFEVPRACDVVLNGERVKLRLLQPRDRVSVTYLGGPGDWCALSVEARTRF